MAIIGKLKKTNPNSYGGVVTTLTLHTHIEISAIDLTTTDNRPNFRVTALPSGAEIGGAWIRQAENGNPYLSVSIDDPSFAAPAYANLVERDGGVYDLIWSRRRS